MSWSVASRSVGWLVRDTFRQSLAYGIFWILLGITVVSTLVCLSIHVNSSSVLAAPGENPDFLPRNDPDAHNPAKLKSSGVQVVDGNLTLAFGAIRIPLARDKQSAVQFLQLVLAGGVADTLGLLLTLVWTAGFLPGFLEGRSVAVLLAKPTPRWMLLVGKYVGVLTFVLVQGGLFVVGTWVAIGLRTNVWDTSYLYAIPMLLLHFAIFFSVSVLLAVWTQSAVMCVLGSFAFWGLAWSINYGHHVLAASQRLMPEAGISPALQWLADFAYWILPKPADLGLLLYDALHARDHFAAAFDPKMLAAHGLSLTLSVLSSLIFTGCVLVFAARRFAATDY